MSSFTKYGLLIFVAVFLSGAAIFWEACSYNDEGKVVSFAKSRTVCRMWCGMRVIEEGLLRRGDNGILFLDSQNGDFAVEGLADIDRCIGRRVSVHGVLQQTPFSSDIKFSEIESIIALKPDSWQVDFRCWDVGA